MVQDRVCMISNEPDSCISDFNFFSIDDVTVGSNLGELDGIIGMGPPDIS